MVGETGNQQSATGNQHSSWDTRLLHLDTGSRGLLCLPHRLSDFLCESAHGFWVPGWPLLGQGQGGASECLLVTFLPGLWDSWIPLLSCHFSARLSYKWAPGGQGAITASPLFPELLESSEKFLVQCLFTGASSSGRHGKCFYS